MSVTNAIALTSYALIAASRSLRCRFSGGHRPVLHMATNGVRVWQCSRCDAGGRLLDP